MDFYFLPVYPAKDIFKYLVIIYFFLTIILVLGMILWIPQIFLPLDTIFRIDRNQHIITGFINPHLFPPVFMGIVRIDFNIPVVFIAQGSVFAAGVESNSRFAGSHRSVYIYYDAVFRFISGCAHAHTVAVFTAFYSTAVYDKGSAVCAGGNSAVFCLHTAGIDGHCAAGTVCASVFHITVIPAGISVYDYPIAACNDVSCIDRHLAAGMSCGR